MDSPAVRVGLESRFGGVESVRVGNKFIVLGNDFNGQFLAYANLSSDNGFSVWVTGQTVTVYDGSTAVGVLEDNAQIRDADGGLIKLGNYSYRGAAAFIRAGGRLTAVNVLTLEEYLYGTVPSEMPSSFQPEALKAQAVASRSYALTRLGAHGDRGYDLCDQGHCQVYLGAEREHANTTGAVDATAGLAAYYGGQPINAVFFSSSGGATDDSANVWTNDIPYLKSVADSYEYEPRVWTRAFSLDEITRLLTANKINIGSATSVGITRVSASGRVQELTLYGTAGQSALKKEEIRTFFSSSAGGALESRNFSIASGTGGTARAARIAVTDGNETRMADMPAVYALASGGAAVPLAQAAAYDGAAVVTYGGAAVTAPAGDGIVFSGRGWGHGVGMSQRGAEGMARLGNDYISILKHYYTGITVELIN